MSYNPFLDPNFATKMKHYQETKDESVFEDKEQSIDNNSVSVVTANITLGDEIVQNLLKEQDDPLLLQEKLKALFSAESDNKDPYPINARDLHSFLGVATQYKDWFNRNADKVDLIENQDYQTSLKNERRADGTIMPIPTKTHHLTLDAAKEIAMIQKSDLGKLVRRYLIWAEKKLREVATVISQQSLSVPKTMGQALTLAGQAIEALEQGQARQQYQISELTMVQIQHQNHLNKIDEDMNKVDKEISALKEMVKTKENNNTSIDSVLTDEIAYNPVIAEGNTTVAETADIFKELGYNIGRNGLYSYLVDNDMAQKLRSKGYKIKKKFLDLGWFVNKLEFIELPDGSLTEKYKVDITPKGRQGLLIRLEARNKS